MDYYTTYQISKSSIIKNVQKLKEKLSPNTLVCAVVKANAYGHDLKTVCTILKNKVDFFGVANINEAKAIRVFDKDTKILIVGKTEKKHYNWCGKNNVSVTFLDFSDLPNKPPKNKLNFHLKIDTGLSRFGFNNIKDINKFIKLSKNFENLNMEGCFTHFATKENDINFILKQYIKFKTLTKNLPKNIIYHCSNSYATLNLPALKLNMVRVGFALYDSCKLACKITSKIINIKKIKKGETVGYDRTFKATKDTTIGVVPIGYADGLARSLSNDFHLYTNQKYVKIIGNICMDICFVDLTGISAKLYDKIEILGKHITLSDYAQKLNTSKYEIMLKFNHARMNIKTIK